MKRLIIQIWGDKPSGWSPPPGCIETIECVGREAGYDVVIDRAGSTPPPSGGVLVAICESPAAVPFAPVRVLKAPPPRCGVVLLRGGKRRYGTSPCWDFGIALTHDALTALDQFLESGSPRFEGAPGILSPAAKPCEELIRFLHEAPPAAKPTSSDRESTRARAVAARDNGRTSEAIAAFEELVAFHGRDAEGHRELAQLYLQAGEKEKSFAAAIRALAITPDDETAFRLACGTLPGPQALTDIEWALRQKLAKAPSEHGVRLFLAQLLIANNRVFEAHEELEIILADDPFQLEALLSHGYLDLQYVSPEQGITTFSRILERSPEEPRALTGLGYCAMVAGKVTEARQLFTAALERHPHLTEARAGLSQLEQAGR